MPVPKSVTLAPPYFEVHNNPQVTVHEASDFLTAQLVPCSRDRTDLAGVPLLS